MSWREGLLFAGFMSVLLGSPALAKDTFVVVSSKFSLDFFKERIAGVACGFEPAGMCRGSGLLTADVTMAVHCMRAAFDGDLERCCFGKFFSQLFAAGLNVVPDGLVNLEVLEMNYDASVVRHALIPPVANVPQSARIELGTRWRRGTGIEPA